MTHDKIKTSLRYSLLDGIFASIMIGFTDTFIAPYALAMGAGSSIIGVLSSVPNLVGAFFQNLSASIVERLGSRQALINRAVLLHALVLIPIISIPYLFKAREVFWLIIFYTAFVSLNLLAFPAWSSMMADHIPESERGRVFGMRNRIFGITNVSAMFLAGLILYLVQRYVSLRGTPLEVYSGVFGFSLIFTIAFAVRIISWKFLTKMYEPRLDIRPEHRFTIWSFLRRLPKTNFGRFVIFMACMNFTVNISGPFLPVYMIKELKFDYLTYTVITLTATLTIFFMMNWWGIHADHIGNRRVIRLSSFFIPLVPFMWLFSHNVVYLVAVQIFAGFFWAGFNLSSSNFIYDAVTPEKRTRCIAYYSVINCIAIFLGALTGAGLIKIIPPLFGYKIMSLFIISTVGRGLVVLFLSGFREVRQVKHVSHRELFYSVIGLRPIIPALSRSE